MVRPAGVSTPVFPTRHNDAKVALSDTLNQTRSFLVQPVTHGHDNRGSFQAAGMRVITAHSMQASALRVSFVSVNPLLTTHSVHPNPTPGAAKPTKFRPGELPRTRKYSKDTPANTACARSDLCEHTLPSPPHPPPLTARFSNPTELEAALYSLGTD